jgi:hypothetical protein
MFLLHLLAFLSIDQWKLSSRRHSASPAYKNFIQVKLQLGELEVGAEVARGKRARKRKPKREWLSSWCQFIFRLGGFVMGL